jgi:bifunctional N-acetylglucosamine-1-phosphate-uridyltransferase/glucosamine-1-phosphate-acetyltransferase GlmU-like protein
MDHTEAGHFAYIGDSILGYHVNLGAGTKLANLQLRTQEEKESGKINPIKITIDEKVIDTGMQKFGAVVGDYVEIGCNSVTCPGALIGKNSWILPNTTVRKGYYLPHSFGKDGIRTTGTGDQDGGEK